MSAVRKRIMADFLQLLIPPLLLSSQCSWLHKLKEKEGRSRGQEEPYLTGVVCGSRGNRLQ
jgi:hypothetical protein